MVRRSWTISCAQRSTGCSQKCCAYHDISLHHLQYSALSSSGLQGLLISADLLEYWLGASAMPLYLDLHHVAHCALRIPDATRPRIVLHAPHNPDMLCPSLLLYLST
jgi:hypothetical protein